MSTSFWQQDMDWSAHQQSWTRSFYQANQNWTRKLSTASSSHPAPAPPPTDQSASASIVNPNALELRIESHQKVASQPGSSSNSASDPTAGKSRLDLLA